MTIIEGMPCCQNCSIALLEGEILAAGDERCGYVGGGYRVLAFDAFGHKEHTIKSIIFCTMLVTCFEDSRVGL